MEYIYKKMKPNNFFCILTRKEKFGVITEIDVQDTLKKKLDVDFRKYIKTNST